MAEEFYEKRTVEVAPFYTAAFIRRMYQLFKYIPH